MRGSPGLAACSAKKKKKKKKGKKKEQSGADLFSRVSTVGACSWIEAASGSSPSWSKRNTKRGGGEERQSRAEQGKD